MYVMADIIYGIPITREMDQWLQAHWEELDLPEEFEELGFCVNYSGNADHQCGYLGTQLARMDEVSPVRLLTDGEGRIVKLQPSTMRGTPQQALTLVPTPEQARQVARVADGVIVGSRILEIVESSERPVQAAASFMRQLKDAIDEL